MQFKPKVDLLVPDKNAFAPFGPTVFSYISIFKKDKKTLVYLCDDHYTNISFDMADFCFSDNAPAKPDVGVVEYENAG
jgi:hypothetical protein